MFWKKKSKNSSSSKSKFKKKKKGVFKISMSDEKSLKAVLDTQIPYSEFSGADAGEVHIDWRLKSASDWSESDLSQFFQFLGCGSDVSTKVLEDGVKGVDFLQLTVFKKLQKEIRSNEKRKIARLYFYYFQQKLGSNSLPTIHEGFNSMITKVTEIHPADSLLSKTDEKTLASFLVHLIDKNNLKMLYFSDPIFLLTVNFKKFNLLVGTEQNGNQIFGLFFHPLLCLIHSNSSFSQIMWLESEEDDKAIFKDVFDVNGKKYALRDLEYEVLETFETSPDKDEEVVMNCIVKAISRCNVSEKRTEPLDFIERLIKKITDYEDTGVSLAKRYSSYVKSHLCLRSEVE